MSSTVQSAINLMSMKKPNINYKYHNISAHSSLALRAAEQAEPSPKKPVRAFPPTPLIY